MKRSTPIATVLVLSLLLAAPAAFADVMTYDGLGLVSKVKLHAPGLLGDRLTVWAGEYDFTYQNTPYHAYCVDIDHFASTTEVTEKPIDFLRNGEQVAYLYETNMLSVRTSTDAAALGVAIWEVLYEDQEPTFDAGSGYFYITGNDAVLQAANALLASVPDSYEPTTNLMVLHSRCKQDMLIGSLGEIPEPATALLLLVGAPLALKKAALRRRH